MNKVVLEESFKTLNEQELEEADFRTVRNEVYDFLEQFYERKVQDFLVDEGVTAMEVKAAVPGYNPDWCPDEYTEQVGDDIITTTDKIFDFNASNAKIDNIGYVWKYDNTLKNEEHIAYINNPNVLCSQIDTTTYSLRLQNSAYLKIPMNKTYLVNNGGFLSGKNFGDVMNMSLYLFGYIEH